MSMYDANRYLDAMHEGYLYALYRLLDAGIITVVKEEAGFSESPITNKVVNILIADYTGADVIEYWIQDWLKHPLDMVAVRAAVDALHNSTEPTELWQTPINRFKTVM